MSKDKSDLKNNAIIVLGCGESILSLTPKEIEYINNCRYVIAMNKYMAFYDKTNILPNCIYFHDELENSFLIYRYILSKCASLKVPNLTIFTSKRFKYLSAKYFVYVYLLYLKLRSFLKWYVLNKRKWSADKLYLHLPYKRLIIPSACKIVSLKLETYDAASNWAKSINDEMFNYKGSLSSILNLCSVISPNTPIYLVGNDFNGSRYFFQDELDSLGIPWKDYTYDLVSSYKKHMSFIPSSDGKTIASVFPLINKNLLKTNNKLYCINPDSLLVKEANVEFKRLPINEI